MKGINFTLFPVLKTKRLILDKLLSKDEKAIFDYRSNKANFPNVDMGEYAILDEVKKYIDIMNAGVIKNQWIIWAIRDKKSKDIVGTVSIWQIDKENSIAEVGYGIFSEFRGRGYMTEALIKTIDYGFDIMGLKTIDAYTGITNEKSIELLKRAGFKKHSDFLETETATGEPIGMVIYRIEA